jgi:hypothetical protein
MNTTSKLGPHTRTNRGTCPGMGLRVYYKAATLQGNSAEFVPSPCVVGLGTVVARARVFVHEVLDHDSQAVTRGAAR